jgi:hypothetical protein
MSWWVLEGYYFLSFASVFTLLFYFFLPLEGVLIRGEMGPPEKTRIRRNIFGA